MPFREKNKNYIDDISEIKGSKNILGDGSIQILGPDKAEGYLIEKIKDIIDIVGNNREEDVKKFFIELFKFINLHQKKYESDDRMKLDIADIQFSKGGSNAKEPGIVKKANQKNDSKTAYYGIKIGNIIIMEPIIQYGNATIIAEYSEDFVNLIRTSTREEMYEQSKVPVLRVNHTGATNEVEKAKEKEYDLEHLIYILNTVTNSQEKYEDIVKNEINRSRKVNSGKDSLGLRTFINNILRAVRERNKTEIEI